MAIPKTQETEILKIVAGLYNAAPGGSILTDFANLIEGGMTTRQLADALAAHSSFTNGIMAGRVTVEDQVDVLMANFGLVADEADPESAGSLAAAFFTEQLEAGVGIGELVFNAVAFLSTDPAPELFADAAALLNNKALVAELYSKEHSSNDLATLQSILAGVSASSPTTAEDAAAYLDSIGQGANVGGTFTLTFGADIFTGGAGNDTFTAAVVNDGFSGLVNSLENIDILDGGAGRDTLNATLDADNIAPVVSNIEVLNIRAVTSSDVDFGDTTGAEQIWNDVSSSAAVLTYTTAPIAATFGLRNTRSTTDIDTFDDVTGTEDNLALAVTSAGNDTTDAVVDSTTDAAAIETMSIAATGENFVDVSAFTAITGLTVTGDGSIAAVVDVTALETVDASGNTGGVTVDLTGAAADLTVTGGSGNDDITAGAGDDTIDAGAGDDRVAFAAAALDNLDTVAGGDGEDTIAFADADDATALDATAHTAFEILELGAAGVGGNTFDNADFAFTKIVLAGDVIGLTVDNLDAGTIEVQDNQTAAIAVTSVGDEDTLGLTINAEAATTIAALDVTGVETVNVTTTADTDDTTFTAIETDGVSALSFAGAGDIIITDITDADATNDATVKIANIDLTGQTGGFEMTANTLGYGTTFTLADLGATATASYDFDDVGGGDEASELFGTLGFTDTFVFTTAFTGNVAIDDIEVGGDLTDDNIDLSALGLTNGIDDLVATDVAAGVLITSDAFEGQILLVGVTGAEVNADDFIF
ncbi:MAG: hypothetical protein KBA82_01725 [Nitrosomonas sp.]|nr:hypothetical protein [Nitrosomonas sp.]MBP7111698.1 hypothetical protein [Nitrosomonas sp.]